MTDDKIILTDAGRNESGFTDERWDCTVRATALFLDWSYTKAHDFLQSCGRKGPGTGVNYINAVIPRLQELGFKTEVYRVDTAFLYAVSINECLEIFNKGRFIFRVAGHVFAVIDGIRYDTEPDLHTNNYTPVDYVATIVNE